MKRHILFLLLLALPASGQSLYDDSTILDLRLQFYAAAWKDSLLAHVSTETDIPARLTVNGTVLDSIGVRYKGNSSYNVQSEKKPFNLSIDAYRPDQLLFGYKTLNLNNFFKDPTCVREMIAYRVASTCFPAARCAFVRLFINDVYWGLYLNVQQINKIFLREHYSVQGGNMYKGDPPLVGAFGADMTWHGSDPAWYRSRYELKTNEEANDWSGFIHFLDVLNNTSDAAFASEIATVLDVDRALWYLAWCNLFVNLDSYPGSGHNYYLYDSPVEGMSMILWDVNEVLGTFSNEQLSIAQRESLSPLYKSADVSRPLVRRLLAVPAFRSRYYAHFRTLFDEVFSQSYWQPLVTSYQNLINAALTEDTRKLYSMAQFTANVTANVNTSMGTVPGILSLINNRRTYLSTLTEFSAPRPAVTALNHTIHAGVDSVTFFAEATAAVGMQLWWSRGNARFSSAAMMTGTDGIGWSVTLPLGRSPGTFRYYCLATGANGLAVLFPPHAEYDTRSFRTGMATAFPVVINEVMASNTNTVRDPQNEYDDWLELYNTSADTIRLERLWLSDDLQPAWRVPSGTVIPPHGHLLVWADDDTLDPGALHANFKISKSGEGVFLWDTTGTILLDSTTFGAQTDDQSWARIPDGTGTFGVATATPGAPNAYGTGVRETGKLVAGYALGQNFPNPFNPSTTIPFDLATSARVRLTVMDLLGRTVEVLVDGSMPAGRHFAFWSSSAASGVYISRLEIVPTVPGAPSRSFSRKLLLMR